MRRLMLRELDSESHPALTPELSLARSFCASRDVGVRVVIAADAGGPGRSSKE